MKKGSYLSCYLLTFCIRKWKKEEPVKSSRKPYTEARLRLAGKQSSELNEYIVHWPAEMAWYVYGF